MDDIEDLKAIVDQLLIQQSIDSLKIKVLTEITLEAFDKMMPSDQARQMRIDLYKTLIDESKLISELPDLVYDPETAVDALAEFHKVLYKNLDNLDQ